MSLVLAALLTTAPPPPGDFAGIATSSSGPLPDRQRGCSMQASFGATRYDHQQERGFDFWVMRDPWGNEFCVLHPNFPELLARRRPWPT
jgi:hypothetical protein